MIISLTENNMCITLSGNKFLLAATILWQEPRPVRVL